MCALCCTGDHGAVPYVEESDHKKKLDQSPSALRPEPASVYAVFDSVTITSSCSQS